MRSFRKRPGTVGEAFGLGAGTLAGVLIQAAAFAITVVVVLVPYRFVPARGLRVRDGLVGAIVTAVLFRLIALASGFIYAKTSRLSVVYGSLTAALVFLYSMYLVRVRPPARCRDRGCVVATPGPAASRFSPN